MMFELPHFALELLVVLPCVQVGFCPSTITLPHLPCSCTCPRILLDHIHLFPVSFCYQNGAPDGYCGPFRGIMIVSAKYLAK